MNQKAKAIHSSLAIKWGREEKRSERPSPSWFIRHRRDPSVTVVISSYRCSSDSEVPISFIFIKISSQFHMLFIWCAQGSGFSIHNQNFIWICWCMIDLYGFHLKIHMGQNFTMFLFGLLCFSLSLFNKHCLVWL